MDELKTIKFMISLYCKKNHRFEMSHCIDKESMCGDCMGLFNYASQRIERCPHKETKTFCSVCKTHCYAPPMREKMREIMKFSGPRMMLYRPNLAISHIVCTVKSKLAK